MNDDGKLLGLFVRMAEHFHETINDPIEGVVVVVIDHEIGRLVNVGNRTTRES